MGEQDSCGVVRSTSHFEADPEFAKGTGEPDGVAELVDGGRLLLVVLVCHCGCWFGLLAEI